MKALNFGHMSQEEVSMINFAEDGESFDFVPPGWMLALNEEADKRGCAVLFLDEWNRGDKALVNALFTLTDERRIHNFELHPNVLVVAAMNPSDGSYIVNEAEKDHAIRKRLNFVYCTHDLTAFIKHTQNSVWHKLVPAFIKSASPFLYDTGARDAGRCFPCPSNWEKVSNVLLAAEKGNVPLNSSQVRTLVEGQIGIVAASKFLDFVQDQNTLIQPTEILFDYTKKSNVRKRVAALLNFKIDKTGDFVKKENTKNRAAIINDLGKGVAIELFSTCPDVAKVAPNLSQYLHDLPDELLTVFVAQHLKSQCDEHGSSGNAYMEKLTRALHAFPAYRARIASIVTMLRDYQVNAGLINETDPNS